MRNHQVGSNRRHPNNLVKAFTVSSAEFMRYDNWSVLFHYLLKASRERLPDREDAFWKYLTETKKLKQSDVYRIVREQPDAEKVVDEIESLMLPTLGGRPQRKLTPEDREAVRDTIQAVVTTYLTKQEAEIAESQRSVAELKGKFHVGNT